MASNNCVGWGQFHNPCLRALKPELPCPLCCSEYKRSQVQKCVWSPRHENLQAWQHCAMCAQAALQQLYSVRCVTKCLSGAHDMGWHYADHLLRVGTSVQAALANLQQRLPNGGREWIGSAHACVHLMPSRTAIVAAAILQHISLPWDIFPACVCRWS